MQTALPGSPGPDFHPSCPHLAAYIRAGHRLIELWTGDLPNSKIRPLGSTLRQLPKQTEPYALLQSSITRGFAGGIREGLLLGRGFGVTKTQILEAINWGTFYGGHESLNLVDEVAGDVLDSWPA
jgi:hypothetical protein